MRPAIVALLAAQGMLLAHSASLIAPTFNEPAHLVAGLSIWRFGRFDLYQVNPPLTHLWAAVPVALSGYDEDWSGAVDGIGARAEFQVGADFVQANHDRVLHLVRLARWFMIPFALIGGVFLYDWTCELFRSEFAGVIALAVWTFDPWVLGHGGLVTPDIPAASMGLGAGWLFWRWLRDRTWGSAVVAGLLLGLALLTKFTWFVLLPIWCAVFLIWTLADLRDRNRPIARANKLDHHSMRGPFASSGQLAFMLVVALYVVNCGYLFQSTMRPLGEIEFVSRSLAGLERDYRGSGNRFRESWLGSVPIPLPAKLLEGIDLQKRDFEDYQARSYLRGVWRDRGWWYYYLYGLAVKTPHGTQLLLLFALVVLARAKGMPPWPDLLVILLPTVTIIVLVSSQTEFNHHVRYVIPVWTYLLVLTGAPAVQTTPVHRLAVLACVAINMASVLTTHPNNLAYFNEAAGRSMGGYRHLAHSNLDWGQHAIEILNSPCDYPNAGIETIVVYGVHSLPHECNEPTRQLSVGELASRWPPDAPVAMSPQSLLLLSASLDRPVTENTLKMTIDQHQIERLSAGVLLLQAAVRPEGKILHRRINSRSTILLIDQYRP